MFKEALYGEDQLRRRVSWALHQIWVTSGADLQQQRWVQEYIEILDKYAFGNYRDLMKEMTLNPGMGEYLDMVRSTRINANENYPREILQLFTIGLDMLNQDGTPILDNQGNRIPTYDQDKVNQFTKVFTGWSLCNTAQILLALISPAALRTTLTRCIWRILTITIRRRKPCSIIRARRIRRFRLAQIARPMTPESHTPTIRLTKRSTTFSIIRTSRLCQQIDDSASRHERSQPRLCCPYRSRFNNNGNGTRGDMKAVVKAICSTRKLAAAVKPIRLTANCASRSNT
jgi:hypothetical protein